MKDQYDEWARQVAEKLRDGWHGMGEEGFKATIAAGLRGAAIEALDHAEAVIAKAAKRELHKDRRAGVIGARMVIRALSMSIKSPIQGDVKPVVQ